MFLYVIDSNHMTITVKPDSFSRPMIAAQRILGERDSLTKEYLIGRRATPKILLSRNSGLTVAILETAFYVHVSQVTCITQMRCRQTTLESILAAVIGFLSGTRLDCQAFQCSLRSKSACGDLGNGHGINWRDVNDSNDRRTSSKRYSRSESCCSEQLTQLIALKTRVSPSTHNRNVVVRELIRFIACEYSNHIQSSRATVTAELHSLI